MVASTGPAPDRADAVVLAMHGIASNLMAWRAVARETARGGQVAILAPDLRGRGESSGLPAPYGLGAHVADMLAVMDHLGVRRAVLAGHSMGAYLAARIAAEHPERVASLVLVDGGLPVGELSAETAAAANALTVGPALARHALTFSSDAAYLDFWRMHPAFLEAWNDDVEAYVLHDLGGSPGARRYHVNVDAMEADSDEMLRDPRNLDALEHTQSDAHVLCAARGTLDDDNPLIPRRAMDDFVARNPAAHVELVEGTNHYSIMLGRGPGPVRVGAAIRAAAEAAAGG
ncbi:MAG TPA: alpha/beta hydrolase [Thermoanaerobaculia bacterium]|nr:alpha/beta hydrolase [Thermoanaerobaculia bacterium]